MMNKKADEKLAVNKLIIIILAILVLLAILLLIFKVPILEWLRNLPDYTYDEDKEIDYTKIDKDALKEFCIGLNKVGVIRAPEGTLGFRKQYITFFVGDEDRPTKLYWYGNEENAEIKLSGGDNSWLAWLKGDLLVAEVNKKIISVEPGFLNLDSEIHQKTRFLEEKPIELKYINKLDKASYAASNLICREGEETPFKPAWPENVEEGKLKFIDPNLVKNSEKLLEFRGLYPYVNFKNSDIKFLYLKNKKGYIQVNGYKEFWGVDRLAPDIEDLFEIYPDGSIWYIERNAIVYRVKISDTNKEVLSRENLYLFRDAIGKSYALETNLRVDYNKIRKEVESK